MHIGYNIEQKAKEGKKYVELPYVVKVRSMCNTTTITSDCNCVHFHVYFHL